MSSILDQYEEFRRTGELKPVAASPVDPVDPATAPRPRLSDSLGVGGVGGSALDALQAGSELWRSVGAGVGDALIETKDFLVGEPEEDGKSQFRRDWEARSKSLSGTATVNSVANDIAQFTTGMLGTGKLSKGGKLARGAFEIARGAAVGAVVFDPYEERLSNLIQSYPALENPVTEFLAMDPNDSVASNRLKSALEGIGLDVALAGTFVLAAKAISLARRGEQEAAEAVVQSLADVPAEAPAATPPAPVPAASPPAVAKKPATQPAAKPAIPAPAFPTGSIWDLATVNGQKVAPTTKAPEVPAAAAAPDAAPPIPEQGLLPEADLTPEELLDGLDVGVTPATEAQVIPSPGPLRPDVTITAEDGRRLIAQMDADEKALWQYGSYDEAVRNGYKFAQGNLPWQKLGTPRALNQLIASTQEVLSDQFDVAKGGRVMTDQQVRDAVRRSAELWGLSPSELMGDLMRAGEAGRKMVIQMESAYLVSVRAFQDAYQVGQKMRLGLVDEFGGMAGAEAEMRRRLAVAANLWAQGQSMRSSAGRSLRRLRGDFAITPATLKTLDGLSGEDLAKVLDMTQGDVRKLKRTVHPSFGRKVIDEMSFLLTNNLLWFYPTHLVNVTTNAYMLAARPVEQVIGGALTGNRALVRKAARESALTLTYLSDAWASMVEAFRRGDSVMAPHTDELFNAGSRINQAELPWRPVKGLDDILYNGLVSLGYKQGPLGAYRNIVGLPTRSLGAVDEFIKTLRYRAVVQADAIEEAAAKGLKGAELTDYVRGRMEEAYDPAGLATREDALREAQIATFQQELNYPVSGFTGNLGAGIRNYRHNAPVLGLILPFVKTPINVLRYAWKMTPGLNVLQTEYRQMLTGTMGESERARALGQMALGVTFASLAVGLAANGKMTGSGPSDPALKSQLLGSGWQPYSIVFDNDDGTKTYFPMGRFDPVGMVMSMAADLTDIMVLNPDSREAEKGAMSVVLALANAFSEKTFLLNVNQFLRAATEPDKNATKFLGGLAGNLIPGSSALRNYANTDPYLREARTLIDNMMKGMPMYSETLPPRRDAFGDPLWRKRSLTTSVSADPVDSEVERILIETGYGVRPPAPSRDGVDLRDFRLTSGQTAYDRLQELAAKPGNTNSKPLKVAVQELIEGESYQLLPDGPGDVKGTRLNAIRTVIEKYREAAYKRLLAENPELRTEVMKRRVETAAALRKNREAASGGSPMQRILEQLNQ